MSDKPLITVTGATGQQGGAVVRALLDRGKFRVRAVTRSTESSAAKALASQGVELARADYDDRESLDKAFEGSHGVFLVTDYWKACGCNLEKELQQGKKLGDSAKQVVLIMWYGAP
jgi:saccharopine dehydrogenase-like NADP-dependent oxidoreductase